MNSRKLQRDAKLEEQCSVLADIIVAIRPAYSKATPGQRALLETTIGAAIWYIPKPVEAWTGRMSIGALKIFHPDKWDTETEVQRRACLPAKSDG